MRLIASALIAMLIAALFTIVIRWVPALWPEKDENLTLLQGRVATPGTPCWGTRKSSSFMLLINVAGTYRSYRFMCDETVRVAAVGGSEVILGVKAVVLGNQDAWRIRTAQVDGRNVFGEPRSLYAPPSEAEMALFVLLSMWLFLVVAAFAVPGEPLRAAVPLGKRRKR